MAHVHGYAEGWAHDSERICDELGLLRDAGERLSMLYGQRWRAARIVIDPGLHLDLPIPGGTGLTESTRWTPELGIAVLRAASGAQESAARFEVAGYLGWPGGPSRSGSVRGSGTRSGRTGSPASASTCASSTCPCWGSGRWVWGPFATLCCREVEVVVR